MSLELFDDNSNDDFCEDLYYDENSFNDENNEQKIYMCGISWININTNKVNFTLIASIANIEKTIVKGSLTTNSKIWKKEWSIYAKLHLRLIQ